MKEKILSLTKKDFEWDCIRGTGKGGQKKNKTSSAVRCRHLPSGAIGYCENSRSQATNKKEAFIKLTNSPKFKNWLRIEIAKKSGILTKANRTTEEAVDKLMDDKYLKIEEIKRK